MWWYWWIKSFQLNLITEVSKEHEMLIFSYYLLLRLTQNRFRPLAFSMILDPNLDDLIIIAKEEKYIKKMKL